MLMTVADDGFRGVLASVQEGLGRMGLLFREDANAEAPAEAGAGLPNRDRPAATVNPRRQ
jgi:hypothetical protein